MATGNYFVLTEDEKKRLDEAKRTLKDYKQQELTILSNNYKFPTYNWLNLIYLYIMGVEGQFPNLLGNNPNTFINDFIELGDKIKEQVKLDLIDLQFNVGYSISKKGEMVVSGANVKFQNEYNDEDYSFSETIDLIAEDAVDYGSGFMMLWKDAKGILRNKHIDPMKIVFNQYDFKNGVKIQQIRKTLRSILSNSKYNETAKEALKQEYDDYTEHLEDIIVLYKTATPTGKLNKKGLSGDKIDIWSFEKEILFFTGETDFPLYWKFDAIKRRGFQDALGIGIYEKGFNVLMGLKKNRERLEVVMEILSKMAFWKKKEGTPDGDAIIGNKYQELEPGIIMAYNENPIEPAELGGEKQFQVLMQTLAGLKEEAGSKLTVNEALQGKTLPSGYSFALGNQQMEMASSVLKEMQKNYGKWLRMIYKQVIIPYILEAFDSQEALNKHLSATDIRKLKQGAINDLVALAEIKHSINPQTINEPFNYELEKEKAEKLVEQKGFIPDELLDQLKENIKDIDINITGERKSKAQTQAFIDYVLQLKQANPQALDDTQIIKLLKAKAKTDVGLTPDEVDELLAKD